jgi:hypothetical protein
MSALCLCLLVSIPMSIPMSVCLCLCLCSLLFPPPLFSGKLIRGSCCYMVSSVARHCPANQMEAITMTATTLLFIFTSASFALG